MQFARLQRLPLWIFFALAFIFSLKSVREPDLWWMIRTGEWMLEKGSVTFKDCFSYTHDGVDWINVKWLYEIILALWVSCLGIDMIFLLQAMVIVAIFYLNYLLARTFIHSVDETIFYSITSIVFLFALLLIDFRIIGRPEMISHIASVLFLYLFLQFLQTEQIKFLVFLIPVQILWSNLHEGFGTGMVLSFYIIGWLWVIYFIGNRKNQPLKETGILLAVILSVSINPRGPALLLHPVHIFNQLQTNQYTTELIGSDKAAYWTTTSWASLSLFVLVCILFIVQYRKKINQVNFLWTVQFGYLGWILLLFYLSLTAYRNIPFFVLAITPMAIHQVYMLWVDRGKLISRILMFLSITASSLCIVFVQTGFYDDLTANRDRHGLQIMQSHNPIAAAEFMKENGLDQRICFSDYMISSYLLWSFAPQFKTYIDLRDLDVFPNAFFDRYNQILQNPALFEEEDQKYNFQSVVLLRRNIEIIPVLYRYLFNSAQYELIYMDPVAIIFAKKTNENQSCIDRYGLKKAKDVFHKLNSDSSSPLGNFCNRILFPFKKNENYKELDQGLIAAKSYQLLGALDLANTYVDLSLKANPKDPRAHEVKGLIIAKDALQNEKDPILRKEKLGKAKIYLQFSIDHDQTAAEANFVMGIVLMEEVRFGEALPYLQAAQKMEPDNKSVEEHINFCLGQLKN
jgi:tetratricopeptide (TPR) repeat protein